jgi:dethiobiotin synthetase
MKGLIIAGIGTEIGKTVVASLFVQHLQADYWKPVQAGSLSFTDTDRVKQLVDCPDSCFHPETYRLQAAMSPHAAADLEGISISLDAFDLPITERQVVVELAGGIMVPLNHRHSNLDLIERLGLPVVLVANYYLGSINHTLLSAAVLKSKGIKVLGLFFNGKPTASSRAAILAHSGLPVLGELQQLEELNVTQIKKQAGELQLNIN